MKDSKQSRTISTGFAGQTAFLTSQDARDLVSLGHELGWNSFVLGQAPLPSEPLHLGDWLIVPAHQDSSLIPERTYERIQAIFAAGLRPKGFLVVHESPKLPPETFDSDPKPLQMSMFKPRSKSHLKLVAGLLGALSFFLVAVTGLVILAMFAIFFVAMLFAFTALAVGAAMVDPILIAVTQDGHWIEIDRWSS